jgi:hypothetical protein
MAGHGVRHDWPVSKPTDGGGGVLGCSLGWNAFSAAPTARLSTPSSKRTLILTTQQLFTVMGTFHQTHLGWTATKHLTIVDLQGPPVWPWIIIQPNKAHILHKLPDELLLLILKLSCHKQRLRLYKGWHRLQSVPSYENNCVMTLSQVCQRFKRIAQPLLFTSIIICDDDAIVPPSMRALKLHRTLRERVDLRRHCRWVLYLSFIPSCLVTLD